MIRRIIAALTACAVLALSPGVGFAQTSSAIVVSACGTPPSTYPAGANRAITQDTTGKLCDSGGGGGGGSNASVGVNGATAPTSSTQVGILVGGNLQPVSASNPVPISGSITASLAGFTPNGSYGTPLAVTTSTGQTALPSGTVVDIFNAGAANAYCNLGTSGSVTSTTSSIFVPAGGGIGVTVGSNTNIACITASGSTTINTAGGAGLQTPFGGNVITGAVTVSDGSGPLTVDGTVTAAQATAANLNATVVGTGTFAVQAAQSGTWTVQPGNTANTTAWLVTNTTQGASGSTAPTNTNQNGGKSAAGNLVAQCVDTNGVLCSPKAGTSDRVVTKTNLSLNTSTQICPTATNPITTEIYFTTAGVGWSLSGGTLTQATVGTTAGTTPDYAENTAGTLYTFPVAPTNAITGYGAAGIVTCVQTLRQ